MSRGGGEVLMDLFTDLASSHHIDILDAITLFSILRSRWCLSLNNKNELVFTKFLGCLAIVVTYSYSYHLLHHREGGGQMMIHWNSIMFVFAASYFHLFTFNYKKWWKQLHSLYDHDSSITDLLTSSPRRRTSSIVMFGLLLLPVIAVSQTGASAIIYKYWYSLWNYLLPIKEFQSAYQIISQFYVDDLERHYDMMRVCIITLNLQITTGFIGIKYIESCQRRKNMLICIDSSSVNLLRQEENKTEKNQINNCSSATSGKSLTLQQLSSSRQFRKSVVLFILTSALPYLLQRTLGDNLNLYAFLLLQNKVHTSVRLNGLFEHHSQLKSMTSNLKLTPAVYAQNADSVMKTTFDLLARKLFSIPKIMLLPGMIFNRPSIVTNIIPLVLVVDSLKNVVMAKMLSKIETLRKESRELESKRNQVEEYDIKNAHLLQRSGETSLAFTKGHWQHLTDSIRMKSLYLQLLQKVRMYIRALYWMDVLNPMIECALAELLGYGHILAAEIAVYSRAIEDTIDLVLMKSRAEAELASLGTSVSYLEEYFEASRQSHDRGLALCEMNTESAIISIENVGYTVGSAAVQIKSLTIKPGIYALTGPNGSGKTSFYQVLLSCKSNSIPIDHPDSLSLYPLIEEGGICEINRDDEVKVHNDYVPISMPSADVVEVGQQIYWPLHSRPIDWILGKEYDAHNIHDNKILNQAVEILQDLQFRNNHQHQQPRNDLEQHEHLKWNDTGDNEINDMALDSLKAEMLKIHKDWLSLLSGGQKNKVELVRKVFLRDLCPDILLLDETFGPLDPESKSKVMKMVKEFCASSIVIVIYHSGASGQEDHECLNRNTGGNHFFDGNLHLQNGVLSNRIIKC